MLTFLGRMYLLNFQADVKILGVGAVFELSIKDIVFNSPMVGIRTNEKGRHTLYTNVSEAKLLNVNIRVERTDPSLSGCGRWGVALIPFKSDDDEVFYKNLANQVPGFRTLDDTPGALIGTSRALEVNYRIRSGRDGRLSFPLPLDKPVFQVMIAYDNANRELPGTVSANEFGCVVTVRGVAMMSRPQSFSGWQTYNDGIVDNLSSMDASVLTKDGTIYNIKDVKDALEARKRYCFTMATIVKTVAPVKSPISLDSMILD